MKRNNFLLFALLPLICFSVIEIFLLALFPAYSRQNKISESKSIDSQCYQDYPESQYPEAKAYCHALVNTKIAESEEIWRNLTPIVGYNKKLRWENNKVNSRVLVVTWTSWDGYEKNIGKSIPTQRDVWVTVVPELKNFCTEYDNSRKIALPYRLNQVLGLRPEKPERYKQRKLAQIWVEPKYLFRPTPDPEITDREAELDFPQSNPFMVISYQYKYWFLNQLMTNNYPWTKLGYTYDWGKHSDWNKIDPSRPTNVGLSEFIIREGAPIKIHSVSNVEDYCRRI